VDGGVDERPTAAAAAADCSTTSQRTSSSSADTSSSSVEPSQQTSIADRVEPERRAENCSSDTGEDSRSQDRRGLAATELTLILRLQRDLATMQLQLSHLQDAMRTANATLQLLLHRAFNDYS